MNTWNAKELYELHENYAAVCRGNNYSPSEFQDFVQQHGSGKVAPEPLLLDFIMNGVWDENQPMPTNIVWTDQIVELYKEEYGDDWSPEDLCDIEDLYVDDFYVESA